MNTQRSVGMERAEAEALDGVLDADEDAAREAVERFDEAFGRHDVDAVMAAMTDDCVFVDTTPPDGIRHVGTEAVRRCWPGAAWRR